MSATNNVLNMFIPGFCTGCACQNACANVGIDWFTVFFILLILGGFYVYINRFTFFGDRFCTPFWVFPTQPTFQAPLHKLYLRPDGEDSCHCKTVHPVPPTPNCHCKTDHPDHNRGHAGSGHAMMAEPVPQQVNIHHYHPTLPAQILRQRLELITRHEVSVIPDAVPLPEMVDADVYPSTEGSFHADLQSEVSEPFDVPLSEEKSDISDQLEAILAVLLATKAKNPKENGNGKTKGCDVAQLMQTLNAQTTSSVDEYKRRASPKASTSVSHATSSKRSKDGQTSPSSPQTPARSTKSQSMPLPPKAPKVPSRSQPTETTGNLTPLTLDFGTEPVLKDA